MPRSRAILALLLIATWITTVLHVGLEANGWMPEHGHHATHIHPGETVPHHEHTTGDEEHEPIFARASRQDGHQTTWLWLQFLPVLGLLLWLSLSVGTPAAQTRPPRGQETLAGNWQFVWRCAGFATAPPGLS